jgi:hypothetical protein
MDDLGEGVPDGECVPDLEDFGLDDLSAFPLGLGFDDLPAFPLGLGLDDFPAFPLVGLIVTGGVAVGASVASGDSVATASVSKEPTK